MDPTANLGVIFDWDGVVIDSHDQHEQAWFRLADELGRPLTRELFDQSFGMRNDLIIPGVFGWADPDDDARIQELGARKETLYREILRESSIEPLPGVRDLLRELQSAGIPTAVGSSTERLNVQTVMEIAGLSEFFAAIAAAEDAENGKPAPDVFLAAARKIGRAPGNCVVLEDAPVGLEAAFRAGMRSIGIAATHPLESLDADLVVETLDGFRLEQILRLFPTQNAG